MLLQTHCHNSTPVQLKCAPRDSTCLTALLRDDFSIQNALGDVTWTAAENLLWTNSAGRDGSGGPIRRELSRTVEFLGVDS